jgi:hypothetical protein
MGKGYTNRPPRSIGEYPVYLLIFEIRLKKREKQRERRQALSKLAMLLSGAAEGGHHLYSSLHDGLNLWF